MAQSKKVKRNKVIDRLKKVSSLADHQRDMYVKYKKSNAPNDKTKAQFHRRKQRRYEKMIFTAESRIDKLNDELGYERGDYKKH